jgi:hypothetical protein
MAKQSIEISRQQLENNIANKLGGQSLWNLCRGNTDSFVEAFESGSSDKIASALRRIKLYSDTNLAVLVAFYQEIQEKAPAKKSK